MNYEPQFKVGRCYLRHDGKPVRILRENMDCGPHYRTVQGDDGEGYWGEDVRRNPASGRMEIFERWIDGSELGYRYDRPSDPGRCTGSNKGEPRNLVVGSNWTLRAMWYRLRCELRDAIDNIRQPVGMNPCYWP